MTWEEDYYRRVRPVVGEALASRHLCVWELGAGFLAAEALARTGLCRQTWLSSGQSSDAFCRSLGAHHGGVAIGEALAGHCREHNHLEQGWALDHGLPLDLDALSRTLRDEAPDLILAGPSQAEEVARLATDHGTPLVATFVPASASCSVHVVWLPGSQARPLDVIQACRYLAALPRLDLDRAEHHVDGLEAQSTALALAGWILTRESRPPRPDLEVPLLEQGRSVLVRGQPDWPWSVRFLSPAALSLPHQGARYVPPLPLLRDRSILVLGLGTASLFCAEAGLLARRLVLVDCKEVTPVNPVRQIYTTRHVGQPKAAALAQILSRRLDPEPARWEQTTKGELQLLASSRWALGFTELCLRERTVERFERLLDQVRPDLVVVGMGRSRNDNFTATEVLRRRGIRHVTPSAFPGVTHFKHIITDGKAGPCYDCLQGHLVLDQGPGPQLQPDAREMFYGGSQPATLVETYPSAHSLLRLATGLMLPRGARPSYLLRELAAERPCFVGANRAERQADGSWLYGADRPFSMVTFGVEDLIPPSADERCSCGRILRARA